MKPCQTLDNLTKLCKPIPDELEFEMRFLDEDIPSYEAFLELLRKAKPKDGSLIFNIRVLHIFVSQEAMKWFIDNRLYKWDPTLKGRVVAVQNRPEINLCCCMIRLNFGSHSFQVNLG